MLYRQLESYCQMLDISMLCEYNKHFMEHSTADTYKTLFFRSFYQFRYRWKIV